MYPGRFQDFRLDLNKLQDYNQNVDLWPASYSCGLPTWRPVFSYPKEIICDLFEIDGRREVCLCKLTRLDFSARGEHLAIHLLGSAAQLLVYTFALSTWMRKFFVLLVLLKKMRTLG